MSQSLAFALGENAVSIAAAPLRRVLLLEVHFLFLFRVQIGDCSYVFTGAVLRPLAKYSRFIGQT